MALGDITPGPVTYATGTNTPRPPAPALTAEEARTVARFDAAPVPPEVVAAGERVERVAQALCTESFGAEFLDEQTPEWQDYFRRLAAAAIAADQSPAACGDLSPSINFGGDSDSERLMCELPVGHSGSHQHDNGDGLPPTRWIATGPSPAEEAVKPGLNAESDGRRLAWFTDDELSLELACRAALASPAPAPHDGCTCDNVVPRKGSGRWG